MSTPRNFLIHVHCSGCQFRASQRTTRRLDVLKNGSVVPSMTSSHSYSAELRNTRQMQKLSTKEEIAGFCIACMEFCYVEAQTSNCHKCTQPLAYFNHYSERTPLERIWDGLTGKAVRCSLCQLWVDRREQLRCGKCQQLSLHGTMHPIIVH